MIKSQLIELIGRRLTERYIGEDKLRFPPQVISLQAGRTYNQQISEIALKAPNSLDIYIKRFKNVEVVFDSDTGLYYSILPSDICPLIDIKSGVRNILPPSGDSVEFIPIARGQRSVFYATLGARINTKILYSVGKNDSNELVVDYFNMTSANLINPVRMYLVIPFDAYDDTDDIHLPGGQDQKFLETVINYMLPTLPKDTKNNNSTLKD